MTERLERFDDLCLARCFVFDPAVGVVGVVATGAAGAAGAAGGVTVVVAAALVSALSALFLPRSTVTAFRRLVADCCWLVPGAGSAGVGGVAVGSTAE